MVIVENIIPRNVIINRGAAEVDNHISRDDIFDYHPLRECNIYILFLKIILPHGAKKTPAKINLYIIFM